MKEEERKGGGRKGGKKKGEGKKQKIEGGGGNEGKSPNVGLNPWPLTLQPMSLPWSASGYAHLLYVTNLDINVTALKK